jgi:hypothetical protein
MKAMFTQQRIQIMHLGKHHEEYTDAYIFAWESGVYPFLHDLGGEHQYLPHELYGDFLRSAHRRAHPFMNVLTGHGQMKRII